MSGAASFAQITDDPGRVARALRAARGRVQRPTGAVVFVAGDLVLAIDEVARRVASVSEGLPVLIAPTTGVMTERGEIEGQPAVAGLVFGGARVASFTASPDDPTEVAASLGAALDEVSGGASGTVLLLADPTRCEPGSVASWARGRPALRVLGGGASCGDGGDATPMVVDPSGDVSRASIAGLFVRCPAPRTFASSASRPLGPAMRVTGARGQVLLELDGQPALDVVTRVAAPLAGRPLVVAVSSGAVRAAGPSPETNLAAAAAAAAIAAPATVTTITSPITTRLRQLRGVDPSRKAVVLHEDVREGDEVVFGVIDAATARSNLEGALRVLAREAAGAAPRFGLLFSGTERGPALYEAPDVEPRLIRARFDDLPVVGMTSAFELGRIDHEVDVHFHAGLFGLFTSPS